jgi:ubiquinone/menaquinone biosynthesis C-methylase UbiE
MTALAAGAGQAMARTPEPELMTGPEQARAYASADLSELHTPLIACFAASFPGFRGAGRRLLDIGCGAADMTIRLACAYPGLSALGIDGSEEMLRWGRERVAGAGLGDAIALERRMLPDTGLPEAAFDTVTANSLLHHLSDPYSLWATIRHAGASGAVVMVSDLCRPDSPTEALALVDRYAAQAHPVVREDFLHSLHAAYTVSEVAGQLSRAGFTGLEAMRLGELHLVVKGHLT